MGELVSIAGGSVLVLHRLNQTEMVTFGRSEDLDLLGTSSASVERPFVDAMRRAIATAPQLQAAVDGLTGRVVRLTAEGAELLRNNESLRTTVLTGVVRNPETGRIAGQLTFINPTTLAGLADSIPAIAGGAAMQLQLARIERSLDELKRDLGYLISHEHLKIEAGLEAQLDILRDVHVAARRDGGVEDDQWDRVANIEASVRGLHKLTAKHLRGLTEALGGKDDRLAARLAALNRALHDERTRLWLRAHVHAELALSRWDAVYLLRQAALHPDDLERLVGSMQSAIEGRHRALAAVAHGIELYLDAGGAVSTWADRLRLIRRAKLKHLLVELDELLRIFRRDLEVVGAPASRNAIPLGDGSPERTRWDILVTGARALPGAAAPVWNGIAKRLPRVSVRRRPRDEDDV